MLPVDEHSYLVIIEPAPPGFSAYVPDVDGCVAAGDTVEECERLIREALMLHFEAMREDGEPIPPPTVAAAAFVPAA